MLVSNILLFIFIQLLLSYCIVGDKHSATKFGLDFHGAMYTLGECKKIYDVMSLSRKDRGGSKLLERAR